MSTAALWKALEGAFDHPNADGDTCRAARDELLALEKACQTLADHGVVYEMDKPKAADVDEAADYLYAIGHAYTERTGGEAS